MTVRKLLNSVQKEVNTDKDKHALYYLLIELMNYNTSDFILNQDLLLDDEFISKYLTLSKKFIEERIPVQHLLGYSYFYNNKFLVNEHTLIPRQETETLLEKTIDLIKNKFSNYSDLNILDLGTGTGCIGITLKLELGCNVTISDISSQALEIANKNIKLNNVNDIRVIQSDLFNNINDRFDVIISNPPYIPIDQEVDDIVNKEPSGALYSGELGMDHINNIVVDMNKYLKSDYIVAFEHGYDQSKLIANLITNNLNGVKMIQEKDYNDKDRFTFIIK